ncbi:sialate O-acetylesterase [Saccharicrinis sp. FJH62]|uniref:sialate O-acetylesterase n=1 Tax=Saccharicrinis sp. FJH62 TaxID=3344657 RepID=UPI0035D502CD
MNYELGMVIRNLDTIKDMKIQFKNIGLILLLLAGVAWPGQAEIKLPALFTDYVVLQQQSDVAVWGWADAKESVVVKPSWSDEVYSTKADKSGKWKLNIKTPVAGGPFELSVSDGTEVVLHDIMIGEVWLCSGQSNMEMPMKGFPGQPVEGSNMDILKSKNNNIRMITVPRGKTPVIKDDFNGKWITASPETVAEFSATGYYFGRLLNEMLDVPVGLIDVTFGGSCIQAWMSEETSVPFNDTPLPNMDDIPNIPNRTPTVLFNSMLNPVIGFGMKGCIWYQGETNYESPDQYEKLFPEMVAEWRKLWNIGEFPFYYMQIAPFDYSMFQHDTINPKFNSAYLRDAQRKSMNNISNSGMAVIMDIGEKTCIHPKKKKVGGERLALWALGDTYGIKGFGFKSPSLNAIEIKGSKVVVSFNDVGEGLTTFGQDLTGFEIAGENKIFFPAQVYLRRKSVVVSSPHVEKPVAVRYAFDDFVIGTLFGTNGLPVSSFRSDEW